MKRIIFFLIVVLFICGCKDFSNEEIQNLILDLSSNDYDVRMNASDRLTEIGGEAVPYIIDSLKKDPYENKSSESFNARWHKVNVLGRIKDERGVDVLVDRITNDKETHVRWRSIWALGNMVNELVYEKLNERLESNDEFMKWNAAVALGSFKKEEAIPFLLEGLNSADDWIKWEAVYVLGILADNNTTDDLIEMLDDDNERVRQESCLTLGKIKDKKAVPYLVNALEDESPGVRWRAAAALVKLGDKSIIKNLEDALEKEIDDVAKEKINNSLMELV